jgi:signal transduction histidine kinase
MLSQADAGGVSLDLQPIKLNDMVGEMVDDLKAQHRELTFSVDMPSGIAFVADQELIWQLTSNLFSNAVKYNRPQGQVNFKARLSDKSLVFSLSNTTHLSTLGLDDRIFERFYRYRETDQQEFTQVAGSGLGLSLCREIVTAHGGTLTLNVENDSWVTLECTLPCGH